MTWKLQERGESFGELREAIISESSTSDALHGSAEVRMGCPRAALWGEAGHGHGERMHSMARKEKTLNWTFQGLVSLVLL